jgi:hypothetical protein
MQLLFTNMTSKAHFEVEMVAEGCIFSSTQGVGENSSQKKCSQPLHFLSVERRERKWS